MRRDPGVTAGQNRGFVLVGVVMFVLALTILGLSLYGLSSYEAQFFETSADHERALYHGQGGQFLVLQMVGTPLGSPAAERLQNAKLAVGSEGIVAANAWQPRSGGVIDSTGAVDWSKSVNVDITARVNGVTTRVHGAFTGRPRRSPYKQLFTSPGLIEYQDADDVTPFYSHVGTTTLTGNVWQTIRTASDSAWKQPVVWNSGVLLPDAAPLPAVSDFITAKLPGAQQLTNVRVNGSQYDVSDPNIHRLVLDAGASGLRYFNGPRSNPTNWQFYSPYYDFFEGSHLEIEVSGVAVWFVRKGMRFDKIVHVSNPGGGRAVLVIAAEENSRDNEGPGQDYTHTGLWFGEGLQVDGNVQVFLVTSGNIRYEDFAGTTASSYLDAQAISMFANGIWFKGPRVVTPRGNQTTMNLRYDPGTMDATVDDLVSQGALPNATGGGNDAFSLVPGSWREP